MFAQPAVATLSSQAPFSTFQENSLSSQTPAELRNFLIDLINNIDIDRLRCSTPDARLNQWKKILRELCQFILTPFTPPADLAWENLHEKIVLIENGLIVINKFCDIRQDYVILFDTHKMAQKIIITLLAIVTSLESRCVPVEELPQHPPIFPWNKVQNTIKHRTAKIVVFLCPRTRAVSITRGILPFISESTRSYCPLGENLMPRVQGSRRLVS